jgi:nucleoside-diphosphate-sugar epimerase
MRADAQRAVEVLRKSSLEYTRFAVGLFMDYFGMPNIPTDLRQFTWAINIPEKRAAIPGTGNEILALTYSKDVARYVERVVDDEGVWPEYSIVSGADVTFNRILELAEEYTGKQPCPIPQNRRAARASFVRSRAKLCG